jgi:hypothetical protein
MLLLIRFHESSVVPRLEAVLRRHAEKPVQTDFRNPCRIGRDWFIFDPLRRVTPAERLRRAYPLLDSCTEGARMSTPERLTQIGELAIPLERDVFVRTLLRHRAGTLHDPVGLDDAVGFISVVGKPTGHA